MKRSNTPFALRLVLWAAAFSIAPVFVVFAFMQLSARDTYITNRFEILETQARLYSDRLEANPDGQQKTTAALSDVLPGYTFFLLGTDGRYIAHTDSTRVGRPAVEDLGIEAARELFAHVTSRYEDREKGILLASFRNGVTDPIAVSLSKIDSMSAPLSGLSGALLLQVALAMVGVIAALGVTANLMMSPANQLADFADQIGRRDFSTELSPSGYPSEFASIAHSLIGLSGNIQSLIVDLEQRVIDRTRELEHRAVQLKATADVGKAITSVRDLNELLQQTTELINERFEYYHVGVFLLDERREYAVLSASNSEGGRRLLEKHHRLKVGEKDIVGYVTESAQARIALDVGQDAVFFDNPDLPNTRSEMALPLVASGQILGVLDVQSTEPQAFSEEDVSTLQTLADQLAIAIQNAYLNRETEKALETARQISGEISRDAWKRTLSYQPRIGFISSTPGTVQIQSEKMEAGMVKAFEAGELVQGGDGFTISLPIKMRGEVIGAIRLKKPEISEAWTQDEMNLAISLSDQLSGALENARLYRESQQRAVRESLISDISARISSASRVESILRETVQELGQVIGDATISFQLTDPSGEPNQATALQDGRTSRHPDQGRG